MALYEEWKKAAEGAADQDQFWRDYFEKETGAYRAILTENSGKLTGTTEELAKKLSLETVEMGGFLDGINTSLAEEVELEGLAEDTALDLTVDFEKLYYNMLGAKAPWLYGLEEWEGVLSEQKREAITKQFKEDHIFHAPAKVGRNDPCPCGSGKKYKKCCGANA